MVRDIVQLQRRRDAEVLPDEAASRMTAV